MPKLVSHACLAMFVLDAVSNAATAEPRRHARSSQAAAGPQSIVCATNNGCHEVPRGCRYEYRRSGHGSVVVVLCDKK